MKLSEELKREIKANVRFVAIAEVLLIIMDIIIFITMYNALDLDLLMIDFNVKYNFLFILIPLLLRWYIFKIKRDRHE